MKKRILTLLLLIALLPALLTVTPFAQALKIQDFCDVEPTGWAYTYLQRAVEDELLNGSGEGNALRLDPTGTLTVAQMAAILTRVLRAENIDAPYPGSSPDSWDYEPAAKAMTLGILPEDGSWTLSAPAQRSQVFLAMAAGFQLERAPQSLEKLAAFSDMASQPAAVRRAAAALLEQGMLTGDHSGRLNPTQPISRQEFVAILYRFFGGVAAGGTLPETAEGVLVCQQEQESIRLKDLPYGLVFSGPVRTLWLEGVRANGPVIVRSSRLNWMTMQNTQLDRLVLAVGSGGLGLTPLGTSLIKNLVIGENRGAISFQGEADVVEVTGSRQEVTLRGVAQQLHLSGKENTVRVDAGMALESITLGPGADGATLYLDGTAKKIVLEATHCKIYGSGMAETVILRRNGNTVEVRTGKTLDEIDTGLDGVTLTITGQDPIPAGGSLSATVTVQGVQAERMGKLRWYQDGQLLVGQENAAFPIREGKTASLTLPIVFSKEMALTTTIGAEILYENASTGEVERVYQEKQISIENYPASYYERPTVEQVLAKVSNVYKGDYTIDYNPDYTTAEKEVFVNEAKGYSSKTEYLLWVNIGTQKVNVFTGSKGQWVLDRTFRCGTGRAGHETRQGVTEVTGKQNRWNKPGEYYCAPIVRFFPGTGYAFHSRLYYPIPNNKTLKDARIGFPISEGCVRMYDEDIQWLHQNIPLKTTVVIY